MRKILITNDDGINSEGLFRLAAAAKAFGEVIVVAPESQCSGMSHGLSIRKKMMLEKVDFPVEDVQAYSLTGTPADCVKVACNVLYDKSKGEQPDVVLSGINMGYNIGHDIQYSGTAAAAFEAASFGILAIAVSEDAVECHEVEDAYLTPILEELIAKPLEKNQIWNVNFPGCKLSECQGIVRDVKISENAFYLDHYNVEEKTAEKYEVELVGIYDETAEKYTDFQCVLLNSVSVGKVTNIS